MGILPIIREAVPLKRGRLRNLFVHSLKTSGYDYDRSSPTHLTPNFPFPNRISAKRELMDLRSLDRVGRLSVV